MDRLGQGKQTLTTRGGGGGGGGGGRGWGRGGVYVFFEGVMCGERRDTVVVVVPR